ncbi:hypothetical protein SAMN02910358_02142 [Lachnospiraceae bacterium XBB1006]|nr:hypothetical protein SAMN02910358_02142 [Lachnospiraceae bacterium XBB1006]
MIKTKRLKVLPFENTYTEAYYRGFDADITKYQYPELLGAILEV